MANQAVEFHDSRLAVLWYEQEGEAVLVFHSLYVHESDGEPAVAPGVGWFERAVLVIKDASVTEFIRAWPCEIFGGEAVLDGVKYRNGHPLPLRCEQSFKVVLDVIDDDKNIRRIKIEGSGAKLTFFGDRRGYEQFPGMNSASEASL